LRIRSATGSSPEAAVSTAEMPAHIPIGASWAHLGLGRDVDKRGDFSCGLADDFKLETKIQSSNSLQKVKLGAKVRF